MLHNHQRRETMASYSGTSKKGNFQEALDLAVQNAAAGIPSEQIKWKLATVSGVHGGFAPQNDLTVDIEASAS
jgi:hypothetical protein